MASSNPQESLYRAQSGQSQTNYATIIRGFMAKGIPESEILPRVNVFTFNAWQAKGRIVKRGEHGVKCLTFVEMKDRTTGQNKRRPTTTTVFHISQTETIGTIQPTATRETLRRAANIYESMTDEALAGIAASGRGKALVQLTEPECSAMLEQMRRAQTVARDAITDTDPDLPVNQMEAARQTIDITPTAPEPPKATLTLAKLAWRREEGYPTGRPAPLYLQCPCNGPRLYIDQQRTSKVYTCQCGEEYDYDGFKVTGKDHRTPRERVHAGQAVNILDLMPGKIDQRPGQPAALKPTIKRREFKF